MGIGVREEARLEHAIRRRLDTRHQVSRRERTLFHFRKVVGRIAIEHQATDRDQREVLLGDRLRQIEDVELVGLAGRQRNELTEHLPDRREKTRTHTRS